MQKTIALALLAASIVAFPVATPSFAYDASKSALCGPDAPEGYKRPGGYCEQISGSGSLSGPVSPTAEEEAGGGPPLIATEAQ